MSVQVDHESIEHFLHSLDTAIDEARRVRSNIEAGNSPDQGLHGSTWRQLMLVEREIELLESKLMKVRRRLG